MTDILEKATEVLRQLRMPDGPPSALSSQVISAGQGHLQGPRRNYFLKRIDRMHRPSKVAALLAVGAVVILGLVVLMLPGDRSSGIVFAEVMAEIQKVQSLSVECRWTRPGHPPVRPQTRHPR